jgi:CRISPR-associated protein Cas2
MAAPTFYLLTYDISDDKRRLKIAKIMESVGDRVQHSVFEAYLTQQELDKLLKRVRKVLSAKDDSLRVYQLCAACREKMRIEGQGKGTPPPGVMIV